MNKQNLLEGVSEAARLGSISKTELNAAYDSGVQRAASDGGVAPRASIANLFYYIGAGIVFLGILILVSQNWQNLNPFGRILISLGSAVLAYIVGALLSRMEKTTSIGSVFFMIAGLLYPIAAYVFLDSTGINWSGFGVQALVAVVGLLIFLLSGFIFKRNIFLFFAIAFGTWLLHAFILMLFGKAVNDLYWYVLLGTGLIYTLLGNYFSETTENAFTPWLYSVGVLVLLGSMLYLGGMRPGQSIFWEIVFPFVDFAIIFLSVRLKSRSFLIFGALFLMIYIIKITTEYFSSSLGWPFVLVFSGFLLMGIGYSTWAINKKYLQK